MLAAAKVAEAWVVAVFVGVAAGAGGSVYAWTEIASPSHVASEFLTNLVWDSATGDEMAIAAPLHGASSTYAFEDGEWTNLGIPTPSLSGEAGTLVYDAKDHAVLLFIDFTGSGGAVQIYAFSHGTWGRLLVHGGPVSSVDYPPSATYDPADGYVLYYGGSPTGCDCGSNQTWSYQDGVWHHFSHTGAPNGVQFPDVVYDASLAAPVLFQNGENSAETDFSFWEFHAGHWTRLAPSHEPHVSGAMGYDPPLSAIVVTGFTVLGAGPYVYLWAAGSHGFTNISSDTSHAHVACTGPTVESLTYDPAESGLVCFGPNYGLWLFR